MKILNTLAQAIPVVTTTLGCEGIAVENEKHVLIADTPNDFAQAVISILRSPEKAQELGHNGRQLILEKYSYQEVFTNLDKLLLPG